MLTAVTYFSKNQVPAINGWHIPVIPVTQEAETGGSQVQAPKRLGMHIAP